MSTDPKMTAETLVRLKRAEDWGVLERGRALMEIDRARASEEALAKALLALGAVIHVSTGPEWHTHECARTMSCSAECVQARAPPSPRPDSPRRTQLLEAWGDNLGDAAREEQ